MQTVSLFALFSQQQSACHQIIEGDLCSLVLWQLSQFHICTGSATACDNRYFINPVLKLHHYRRILQRGWSGVVYGVMSHLEHAGVLSASTGNCVNTLFHIYVSLPGGQRMTTDDLLLLLTSCLSLWLILLLCLDSDVSVSVVSLAHYFRKSLYLSCFKDQLWDGTNVLCHTHYLRPSFLFIVIFLWVSLCIKMW